VGNGTCRGCASRLDSIYRPNQLTEVGHNGITLGNANVGIIGPQYPAFPDEPAIPSLEGAYSAIIQDGGYAYEGAQPASIAQTGLIPSWAKSVQFESELQLGQIGATLTNSLFVSIGGQTLSLVALSNSSTNVLFGCDVSAFAASVEELRFTMGTNYGNALILLDAITFSPEAVPEPSTWCLFSFGVGGLICWCRARGKDRLTRWGVRE